MFVAKAESARIHKIEKRQTNSTNITIRDAVAHPNATGTWPINGIDVTKPLLDPPSDDYGPGNGWSINIAIATNITADKISTSALNPAVITLEVPENAFQGVNSSTNYTENYDICSFAWFENVWTVEELEKLQDDVNGFCNGIISDECIKETKEVLGGNVTFNMPNGTSTNEGSSSQLFGIWGPYSNRSEAGLRDAYDTALTNVYPLLLTYTYEDGETRSNYSVFRCVHANNIVEGSREPGSFGSNRRSSAVRSSWSTCSAVVGMLLSFSLTMIL
ncbi:hypothetical protein BDP81DRAFT_333384 [Colletotrichum phormii]|uniref:Uncharacterized protein n=1 Tax=Colletotrichum phormii TaxID=359342 RepID=A0AAJ0EAL1_9PEZI|nr:uncharacterized protein BDP81DRAFT_333384 [Colletotrichum phormii]KAK1622833.1 hypothetical protein BDP81DRAFT_333384 [Colletotrichum phormii]